MNTLEVPGARLELPDVHPARHDRSRRSSCDNAATGLVNNHCMKRFREPGANKMKMIRHKTDGKDLQY